MWRFNHNRASFQGVFLNDWLAKQKCILKYHEIFFKLILGEFLAILTEMETTINCRLFTYVDESLYVDKTLIPSHLLLGYKLYSLPIPIELLDIDSDYQSDVKWYKYLNVNDININDINIY